MKHIQKTLHSEALSYAFFGLMVAATFLV